MPHLVGMTTNCKKLVNIVHQICLRFHQILWRCRSIIALTVSNLQKSMYIRSHKKFASIYTIWLQQRKVQRKSADVQNHTYIKNCLGNFFRIRYISTYKVCVYICNAQMIYKYSRNHILYIYMSFLAINTNPCDLI